jgi:hypothetical protein
VKMQAGREEADRSSLHRHHHFGTAEFMLDWRLCNFCRLACSRASQIWIDESVSDWRLCGTVTRRHQTPLLRSRATNELKTAQSDEEGSVHRRVESQAWPSDFMMERSIHDETPGRPQNACLVMAPGVCNQMPGP